MMRKDNPLFPPNAYKTLGGGRKIDRRSWTSVIKGAMPSRSVNIARKGNMTRLARERGGHNVQVLVIGCGQQKEEIQSYFDYSGTNLVFCDVDKSSNVDLFCDAHQLPFRPESFDGVISTAVMEHVLKPWVVAEEIHRVLKPSAFLYSEIPFLQAVHEGPYDFMRFTLGGHRVLFEKFDELDSGVVAGPGTALNWMVVEFIRAIPRNRRISILARMITLFLFAWTKYVDFAFGQVRRAQEAASCTYFYGRRRETAISPAEIIKRYGQTDFTHV
jgi:SAM-dependent methyltransferase